MDGATDPDAPSHRPQRAPRAHARGTAPWPPQREPKPQDLARTQKRLRLTHLSQRLEQKCAAASFHNWPRTRPARAAMGADRSRTHGRRDYSHGGPQNPATLLLDTTRRRRARCPPLPKSEGHGASFPGGSCPGLAHDAAADHLTVVRGQLRVSRQQGPLPHAQHRPSMPRSVFRAQRAAGPTAARPAAHVWSVAAFGHGGAGQCGGGGRRDQGQRGARDGVGDE